MQKTMKDSYSNRICSKKVFSIVSWRAIFSMGDGYCDAAIFLQYAMTMTMTITLYAYRQK